MAMAICSTSFGSEIDPKSRSEKGWALGICSRRVLRSGQLATELGPVKKGALQRTVQEPPRGAEPMDTEIDVEMDILHIYIHLYT